jgi:intergrase/recombinase
VHRSTIFRWRNGRQQIGDIYVKRILSLLSEEEFEEELSLGKKLEAIGILDEGRLNYTLFLEVLAAAKRDPYAKNLLVRYVATNFREDLKRLVSSELEFVELKWTRDFEEYLRNPPRGKPIRREDTIKYYRSIFKKHLEGRKLSRKLVEEVAEHGNHWLRNVFRHYAWYLYHRGLIEYTSLNWILVRVPGRRILRKPRNPPVDLKELRGTLKFLRENHREYYVLYRLMLESGLRFEHALYMLASYNPEGNDTFNDRIYPRLYCDSSGGFCRYLLGIDSGVKRAEFTYFSLFTGELIQEIAPWRVHRRSVERYVKRHGLVRPKVLRKASW